MFTENNINILQNEIQNKINPIYLENYTELLNDFKYIWKWLWSDIKFRKVNKMEYGTLISAYEKDENGVLYESSEEKSNLKFYNTFSGTTDFNNKFKLNNYNYLDFDKNITGNYTRNFFYPAVIPPLPGDVICGKISNNKNFKTWFKPSKQFILLFKLIEGKIIIKNIEKQKQFIKELFYDECEINVEPVIIRWPHLYMALARLYFGIECTEIIDLELPYNFISKFINSSIRRFKQTNNLK